MLHKLIAPSFALLIAAAIYWGSGLEPSLAKGLALLSLVATLWITEAIHITATALLVPVLAVVTGILTTNEALASFANPIIFLFLGGFAMAGAMHKYGLDEWLALQVIKLARGRLNIAIGLLLIVTAFISMWISNTATTVMMLPIALGLLSHLDQKHHRSTFTFVLLGIAYSANIGGLGTIVGSPPNAIAASLLHISFIDWMKFGIPAVMVILPVSIVVLWLCIRPQLPDTIIQIPAPKPWTAQIRWLLVIFSTVVSLWLMSKPISEWLGVGSGFDALVAVIAIVVLVGSGLIQWKEVEKSTDWGVLLLFGGGLTLSVILSKTGSSTFLADSMVTLFAGTSPLVFLAIAVGLMIFLTELASNTASAALLIPVLFALPESQIGLSPVLLSIAVAMAASCAFMLPVATPPNAIVYGTGLIKQRQMMHIGLCLNILGIGLITTLMTLLY
jgi:sodium-dependent dicarboxylate transporter 2/3/5